MIIHGQQFEGVNGFGSNYDIHVYTWTNKIPRISITAPNNIDSLYKYAHDIIFKLL